METLQDVKFINVYVVRKIYSMSKANLLGGCGYVVLDTKNEDLKQVKVDKVEFPSLYPKYPDNIIETFVDENKAVQRAEELANQPDKYPYVSKITTKKHLAVTADNGKTVSLLDCLNTFEVKA